MCIRDRNSGSGTLQGTKVLTVVNGVATYTNLSHNVSGTINVSFGASGFSDVTSTDIVISAATADHLAIGTQPSSTATAGVAFVQQPVIRVEDAFNNVVSSDNTTVITAARNSGSGTLQGSKVLTVVNGVATYTNLSHNVAGTINVSFSASGFSAVTSTDIVISAAAADHLAIGTQPCLLYTSDA